MRVTIRPPGKVLDMPDPAAEARRPEAWAWRLPELYQQLAETLRDDPEVTAEGGYVVGYLLGEEEGESDGYDYGLREGCRNGLVLVGRALKLLPKWDDLTDAQLAAVVMTCVLGNGLERTAWTIGGTVSSVSDLLRRAATTLGCESTGDLRERIGAAVSGQLGAGQ